MEDELSLALFETSHHFLHHMCPFLILGELNDVALQCVPNEVFLFRKIHQVKHGLDSVRALLVATYINELRLNALQYGQSLVAGTARE